MDGGPEDSREGTGFLMDLASEVEATRRRAGLFALSSRDHGRGLLEVTGGDARRWLDGMVTNETLDLAPGDGCYAALLTPKGRIVADLHVLAREQGYWLETSAWALASVVERLERYIIADDVQLADVTGAFARWSLEGPEANALLGVPEAPLGSWRGVELQGIEILAARFGWSGETAWQLFVPRARHDDVLAALDVGVNSDEALEVLRIEAGIPLLGAELDEQVFPDEARLESAISRSKGCYTGQEIVARLHSRGAVNHLLVALAFDHENPPAVASPLLAGERVTGRVTSTCQSPSLGPIGLGFTRVEHSEPGTQLTWVADEAELGATVVELPRMVR